MAKKEPETLSELIRRAFSGNELDIIVTPELARELGIDTDQLEVVTDDDDQDADAGGA